jgi:SH3 domain protein
MISKKILFASVLAMPALVVAGEARQYVSDEITLSIRDQPSNTATVVGSAKSGDPVTVLQTLGEQSFSRIRTTSGVEGWVTSRFISNHPAAREELLQTRQALDGARKQVADLQKELEDANKQLAGIKPAQELAADNKKLRDQLAEKETEVAQLEGRFDMENARRQTLLAGGILVAGGIVLGLLLPWLGRRKRRRYSDF